MVGGLLDAFTGWLAIIRGIPLNALPADEADDLVAELNERDARDRALLSRLLE